MSSREEEVRSLNFRRRNLLYLIEKYLVDNGLTTTAQSLRSEARLISDYEICDNIDLDSIYLEYASYFQVKFGKYPRILKKTAKPIKLAITATNKKVGVCKKDEKQSIEISTTPMLLEDSMKITQVRSENRSHDDSNIVSVEATVDRCEMFTVPEWKEISDVIKGTIVKKGYGLQWKDMSGNTNAIKILQEAVIMPLKMPHLFMDSLKPWKSVLLHGPPGTGKTLLAKIVCSETMGSLCFFNVTSSIVTSKWRGDSEKIVKILFQMAKLYAPSIIFIDEIEGLTSKRDRTSDHEASKRFKNEFLQQLDGMEDSSGIFILASTNLPWEIDVAFLRRFEKKVLIQLPNLEERRNLIKKFLTESEKWTKDENDTVGLKSEGFTGDEIRIACKEVAMQQISRITSKKEVKPIRAIDLMERFEKIQPTGNKEITKFKQWQNNYEIV